MKIAAKCAPLEKELKMLQNLGFCNVELFTTKKFISIDYVKIAKKFVFNYVVHSPTDYIDKDVIDFAIDVGADIVGFHNFIGTDISKIYDYAKSHGIILCVENHRIKPLSPKTPEQFIEMKKKFQKIKLLLDTEHAISNGFFNEFIEKCGKDIYHIHIVGSPPGFHKPPQENPEQTRIIIQKLKNINYRRFIVSETDLQYFRENVLIETKKFLESLI